MRTTLPEDFISRILGRNESFFAADLNSRSASIDSIVRDSSFLVIGGAGTIGQAVTKEIFKRGAKQLDVIDISENNLAELVRDIRCTHGYKTRDFSTYCFDTGTSLFDAFIEKNRSYNYIFNLSALKHVRSERDPYTLARLLQVNILNTKRSIEAARVCGSTKYFSVSSDKATNPANLMGASKRIMEYYLESMSSSVPTSTARFANVAFSDGSLPHSFLKRIEKRQPIAAPSDVKRYFITPQESGELCLLSCLFGENRDVFIPKTEKGLTPITFSQIAEDLLEMMGLEANNCSSEEEAIRAARDIEKTGQWPVLFGDSDTSGEKPLEEFSTDTDRLDENLFESIRIIKQEEKNNSGYIEKFEDAFSRVKGDSINMDTLTDLITYCVPELQHKKTSKSLDEKM